MTNYLKRGKQLVPVARIIEARQAEGKSDDIELEALREEFKELLGREPNANIKVDTLKAKIKEAKEALEATEVEETDVLEDTTEEEKDTVEKVSNPEDTTEKKVEAA